MEILAPVGGREQLIAAIRCGAGAVYLGAKGFNARRNAENFESCDLEETVRLCHSHNVKVHVTLNTLVMDSELSELYKTADEVARAGVDAVIVQDLAVMEYLKSKYPELHLHASTQAVVHNAAGAEYMKKLGYSRIVLARELSIDEIRKIHESVDIELEAFVHGALCMSVSGACYMSGMLGGRSGNRGLCAQPCRLDFKSGNRGYALSLKDMSHIKYVSELEKAGICSLKIEGRMKRPEYVAASVLACKAALEGKEYDEETLRAVFSRGGFTDGYYKAKRDVSMFGHREKEDVTAAAGVLKKLAGEYHKENPILPVDMELYISEKENCVLKAVCLDKCVTVEGEPAIVATGRPTDESAARQNLSKCGGTQFYLRNVSVTGESGLMVPPSVLNGMRREVLKNLDELLGEKNNYDEKEFAPIQGKKHIFRGTPSLWARFFKAEQITGEASYERIIVPLFELARNSYLIEKLGDKLAAELPAVAFPEYEDRTENVLRELKNKGLKAVYAENVYGIEMGKKHEFEVLGGAGLNILNSRALDIYKNSGVSSAVLSFEIALAKAQEIYGDMPRGIVAYGRLPLMRVRNCPARTKDGCKGCKGDRNLTDRKGITFPVLCEERYFSTILNSVPLHIADRKTENIDFLLLYFTRETKSQCAEILDDYINHRPAKGPRTGGLYFRTLA